MTKDSVQWPDPQSREVALFTDLSLYGEALTLALEQDTVTVFGLQQELGQRFQKMRLVDRQSRRTVERLMRELRNFGWLQPIREAGVTLDAAPHAITDQGADALALSKQNPRSFRRVLTVKMQEVYVVPGWFVSRLWQINPTGQGELILPGPSPEWRPPARDWEDCEWDGTLQSQTLAAARNARLASHSAFPISDRDWIAAIMDAWTRLSSLKPRGPKKERARSFSPRSRLSLAMREATVGLLFGRIPYGNQPWDFAGSRPPIYLRTFMGWCPRLEELELVFYTDWHPQIYGRLLFPTCVFRDSASLDKFEEMVRVRNPRGLPLWLHQPQWGAVQGDFVKTLISVHKRYSTVTGSLYISLLDVRDEVCRQLRLSPRTFDSFLEKTIVLLPTHEFRWSIAVETDVREEQSSGSGQYRRPVYLGAIPHTLIALASLPPTLERSMQL